MMHEEEEILMSDLDPEELGEEDELDDDLEGVLGEDDTGEESDPFGEPDSEEESW